jgi:hypothetical protein
MSRMDKKTSTDFIELDSHASSLPRENDLLLVPTERLDSPLDEVLDRLNESNWFCEVGEA